MQKKKPKTCIISEFLPKQLFGMRVFPGSVISRLTRQQTRLREWWKDGKSLVMWTLECLLEWWDWTVMEVQIWSRSNPFFSVFVHPCHCRPLYSNEKALMIDWKINWMGIKRGLNPAVNVWALACQDNTADSVLNPWRHFVCELSSWLALFFILALIAPLVWQLSQTWHWFVYSSSSVFREEDPADLTFHHTRGIFISPFVVSDWFRPSWMECAS